MGIIKVAGKSIEVDEGGYLVNRSDWNEEVAMSLARADGIELTPAHWEIISFIREYYDEHQTMPSAYVLARAMHERLGPGKDKLDCWPKILPPLYIWRAFQYAGLPSRGTINVSGKRIEVDFHGCLINSSDWSEEVAKAMAKADDFELTPDHWEVINFLREYYDEYQCWLPFRDLSKAVGKKLGPAKGRHDYLFELFPRGWAGRAGPVWPAARYAGLPVPIGTITAAGKIIETDGAGYLVNPSDWSEDIAKAMARADNLDLTPDHWEVINSLRQMFPCAALRIDQTYGIDEAYALDHGAIVEKRAATQETQCEISQKYSAKHLYELFPQGPTKQAVKYAGLLYRWGMSTMTVAGMSFEVDEQGFLCNRCDWNEEVAKAMAKADGLDLTPEHWEVINFMRAYYDEYLISPDMRVLTKVIGKKLGPDKGNIKYLYTLFPYGLTNQGCKYAGLPRRTGLP